MIKETLLPELNVFRKIEEDLPLAANFDYGKRVVENGNRNLPVHRWFKFKESFSADLLGELLREIAPNTGTTIRLLDPFCGVGTSLVASQEMSANGFRIDAIGIERNPFIAFVANTKISWSVIDSESLLALGEKVLRQSRRLSPTIPSLSSLTTGRCISRYLSKRLLAICKTIESLGNSATHKALLLGVASSIESVSKVRKDGRALRLVKRAPSRLDQVVRDKWAAIAADAKLLQMTIRGVPLPQVVNGDGRKPLAAGIKPDSIDLILTSPPYPNNIDYSEVYKLELWLLGFIGDAESFLHLRKSTFRSHPTSDQPDNVSQSLSVLLSGRSGELLKPILNKIDKTLEPWRKRVLVGYFHDMLLSLKEQHRCLKKGGLAAIVVGNSLHGGSDHPYVIPTDMIVSTLAEQVGFQLKRVVVARALKRRIASNHFLRESLIVLKKN